MQKCVTLSSGEAELAGVVNGASEGLGIQSVATGLGRRLDLHMHADSSAAEGICHRSGIGKVRHRAVTQLWAQERLCDKTSALYRARGGVNPADVLAAHIEAAKIVQHATAISLRAEGGRATSAPRLAAEVE